MDEFDARLGEIILVPNVATLTEITAEGEPVGYAVGSSTYALVLIREERQEDGQMTVHTRWAKRFNEAETPFSMQAAFNALHELQRAAGHASGMGLAVHAGHGLTLANVPPIAAIPAIEELNIGHTIVSRAISIGIGPAVA